MKENSTTHCLQNRATHRISRLVATTACLLLVCAPAWAVTFIVNSTADPGDGVCDAFECTFREAINAANANPGVDVIAFNIGGGGAQTIQPQTGLPPITDAVVIDGTTQPGFSAAPLIEIDGSVAGGTALRITAGASTVRALSLDHFPGSGISLENGDGNLIANVNALWSGLIPTGYGVNLGSSSGNTIEQVAASGRHVGIALSGDCAANTLQNNVLAGNNYAIDTYNNTGQANRYLNNDLSGCTYSLRLRYDVLFEVAGNNFDGSGTGIELLDMAGINFAPPAGTVDLRRTTAIALRLGNVINSRVAGLDLSWIGGGQSGFGLHADSCANLTVENVTAQERSIAGFQVIKCPGSLLSAISSSASGPGFVGYGMHLSDSSGATVQQFTASGRHVGIALSGIAQGNLIRCSSLRANNYGISDQTSGTGNEAHENYIAENAAAGVQNLNLSSAVNAENNYWGTPDGPAPIGSGNPIVGNVDAHPFLTSPPPCLGDADRDPPVVTCLPAINAPFGAVPSAATSAAAFIAQGGAITDNRDPSPSVTSSDAITGFCPLLITRTYIVTDASGNSTTCHQLITVNNLLAEDSIIWHQPLARNGASEDTDPSAGGTLKYRFKQGSTIPIQIHVQGCGGTDVTGHANVIGTVEVFGDTNCEGVADGNSLPIDFNGVGEAGGVMDKIDGHLKFNLDTKKLPQTAQCYLLRVTVSDSSTGESRSEIVPLQAK